MPPSSVSALYCTLARPDAHAHDAFVNATASAPAVLSWSCRLGPPFSADDHAALTLPLQAFIHIDIGLRPSRLISANFGAQIPTIRVTYGTCYCGPRSQGKTEGSSRCRPVTPTVGTLVPGVGSWCYPRRPMEHSTCLPLEQALGPARAARPHQRLAISHCGQPDDCCRPNAPSAVLQPLRHLLRWTGTPASTGAK